MKITSGGVYNAVPLRFIALSCNEGNAAEYFCVFLRRADRRTSLFPSASSHRPDTLWKTKKSYSDCYAFKNIAYTIIYHCSGFCQDLYFFIKPVTEVLIELKMSQNQIIILLFVILFIFSDFYIVSLIFYAYNRNTVLMCLPFHMKFSQRFL